MKPSGGRKRTFVVAQKAANEDDISVLGVSLDVVRGVKHLLQAIQEGTEQFKDILFNECSLIYECKVCHNLFRSVANLISHKQRYCTKSFSAFNPGPSKGDGRYQHSGGENDVEVGQTHRVTSVLSSPLTCFLQKLPGSNQAVLQSLFLSRTSQSPMPKTNPENVDLKEVVAEPATAVLSEDGGVVGRHFCPSCKAAFSTSTAMSDHVAVFHKARTCYPCPICKLLLATPFSVYRHLSKMHGKTEEQIRRLRQSIIGKGVNRELYQERPPSETNQQLTKNPAMRTEEEKWNAQFEGKLHCGVCGKKFSRRAALDVHSSNCKPAAPKVSPISSGPLRCEKCGMEFVRRAVLTAHLNTCTGRIPPPLKAHLCRFCGRAFPRRRLMTVHASRCPRKLSSPLRYLQTPTKTFTEIRKVSPSVIQASYSCIKTSNQDKCLPKPVSPSVVRRLTDNHYMSSLKNDPASSIASVMPFFSHLTYSASIQTNCNVKERPQSRLSPSCKFLSCAPSVVTTTASKEDCMRSPKISIDGIYHLITKSPIKISQDLVSRVPEARAGVEEPDSTNESDKNAPPSASHSTPPIDHSNKPCGLEGEISACRDALDQSDQGGQKNNLFTTSTNNDYEPFNLNKSSDRKGNICETAAEADGTFKEPDPPSDGRASPLGPLISEDGLYLGAANHDGFPEDTRAEFDSDSVSLVSRRTDPSCDGCSRDETSSSPVPSGAPTELPEPTCTSCYDSGVSDDGCLSEPSETAHCAGFVGFDLMEIDSTKSTQLDVLIKTIESDLKQLEPKPHPIRPFSC